jgi:predicted ester cyclase
MNISITAQQLAERIQTASRSGDPAVVASLYTEDAVMYQGSDVARGREAIKENYAGLLRAFPDSDNEFWNIMTCGEHFIYEGTWRGTHTGPLPTPEGDIPPTGRKIELPFAFIAKMSPEGLIQEDRTYFDSALMMQQLGLG